MPARVSAISVARPARMTSAANHSPDPVGGTPIERVPIMAESRANLATKPDSGGSPERRMALAAKQVPRIASVDGIVTPSPSSAISSSASP